MTAEIILLPKSLRMDWMDLIAVDPRTLPPQFYVAGVIGSHFGNKSGLTYVSKKTIAKVCRLSVPTVERAIAGLEQMGYLIVERREVGHRADGRKVFGGRGTANVYLPACDASQVSATDRGQKLVTNARRYWQEGARAAAQKHIVDDVLSGEKHIIGDVVLDQRSTSPEPLKHLTHDVPTLKLPTEANSTPNFGHGAVAGPLGVAGDALRKRLGDDKFRAWFGDKVAIYSEDGDTVTLAAPTKFIRDYIIAQFLDTVLDVWRRIRPATKRIDVIVAAERKAG